MLLTFAIVLIVLSALVLIGGQWADSHPSHVSVESDDSQRDRRKGGTVTRGRPPEEGPTRVLNVVVAAIGIVLFAPLMLLIGIAVAATSKGPILYRQVRVGRDRRLVFGPSAENGRRMRNAGGKLFTMFKFRTMMHPSSASSSEVRARSADPRITPIGRRLRLHRLDEIPQLFNVLRGDMNVVGPRPEQPQIFLELREQVDGYAERQVVLPGITGWAQINHPYDRCIDDVRKKVEFDLQYLDRRSAVEDFRIMIQTLPVMVAKRGAL